jgi:hypothetical protein
LGKHSGARAAPAVEPHQETVDRPATREEILALRAKHSDWDFRATTEESSPEERERLIAKWRSEVRFWPLFFRWHWLSGRCGRIVHGDSACRRLLIELEARIQNKLLSLPSSAWAEAWGLRGIELPRHEKGRRHASRMKRPSIRRQREMGTMHLPRRWMPDIAFDCEMKIDELPVRRAISEFQGEASISAVAIEQIAMSESIEMRWAGREDQVGIETFDPRDREVLRWKGM